MTLAEVLSALRHKRKWSQEHLAGLMGVHRNTVWRLETHPDELRIVTLLKAAAALEVPAWKILRHVDAAQRTRQD